MTNPGNRQVDPRTVLALSLGEVAGDASSTFTILQQNLAIDLDLHLGLRSKSVEPEDMATVHAEPIKGLGQLVVYFLHYGTMSPTDLGAWLAKPNGNIWHGDFPRKPIEVAWGDLQSRQGLPNPFFPGGMGRVINAAKTERRIRFSPQSQLAERFLLSD